MRPISYYYSSSARWNSAVRVYKSSRAHSPTSGRSFDEEDPIDIVSFILFTFCAMSTKFEIKKLVHLLDEIVEIEIGA